jgi:large subunit ribosomal protein L18
MAMKVKGRAKRKLRIRKKVSGTPERPRLSVFRSNKHIYAQVVDDRSGRTLASVCSLGRELPAPEPPAEEKPEEKPGDKKGGGKKGGGKKAKEEKMTGKIGMARIVGAAIAEACKEKQILTVVFDRGGYRYHGRVKALADAARKGGLKF